MNAALAILLISSFTASAGQASWYGEEHRGKLMANGKPFNPSSLTCASWFHPLGSKLKVTHGGKSVSVVCTDRGPNKRLVRKGRTIDLSEAAFAKLANRRLGLIKVTIKSNYGNANLQ